MIVPRVACLFPVSHLPKRGGTARCITRTVPSPIEKLPAPPSSTPPINAEPSPLSVAFPLPFTATRTPPVKEQSGPPVGQAAFGRETARSPLQRLVRQSTRTVRDEADRLRPIRVVSTGGAELPLQLALGPYTVWIFP